MRKENVLMIPAKVFHSIIVANLFCSFFFLVKERRINPFIGIPILDFNKWEYLKLEIINKWKLFFLLKN